MLGDTIAAVSTPRGKGGVAMIRISGARAVEIASRVFLPKSGGALADAPVRTALYGAIVEKDISGDAVSVDDGIAIVYRAPASFTGEDTVELTCHGGVLLTETVLSAVIAAGARCAEAGEFTRRAFINGKLGLSAAEALGELLEAQTRTQMKLAHAGMRGRLEGRCREIYEKLCAVLASIYVKIDYPDEDLAEMSREEIAQAFDECAEMLTALVATYRTGHAVAEGIPTVICGRPNVGKSSLYNRLVGREAAIVTSVEGTTRDLLSETVSLGGVTLRLFDTAGLHDTADPVERIGIDRARKALDTAELILAVFDGSAPPTKEDLALIETLSSHPATVIAVINKRDRGDAGVAEYERRLARSVSVCAANGDGMETLAALVKELFMTEGLDLGRDPVLANARQHGAAAGALDAVRRAKEALAAGEPIELVCADAEEAMQSISEVDGRAVSEDIVTQIFSRFCVGK